MIWIIEGVVLLIFVGFGGFEGFIVWAVLSALTMFGRFAYNQTKLKAAEVMLQAERNARPNPPVLVSVPVPVPALTATPENTSPRHMWIHDQLKIDFRTMTAGEDLIRRVSPVQWERKSDPDGHKVTREAMELLVSDENEELRNMAQAWLAKFSGEPAWELLPEKYIASIETQYQRYPAHGT